MYVPKVPMRSDFCGCPPCPLCYDWVEPNLLPTEEIREGSPIVSENPLEVGYRIDGMRKMTEDLLGPNVTPTNEQKAQLYQGAERIHLNNLAKSKVTPEKAHQDTIDEVYTRRGVEAFLAQKRKEASSPKPKVNYVTCDDIADQKAKEGKAEVPEEVKEKIKNNVPVPSPEAPVDYDLLRRESQQRRSNAARREDMVRRYRDQMEREKMKWAEKMGYSREDIYKILYGR